jgi:dihydroorotate dehydrogenase
MYKLIRPLLFKTPPETIHSVVTAALKYIVRGKMKDVIRSHYKIKDERLEVNLFDTCFENPVGVAAGFDKNGEIVNQLAALGFGYVEIGAVTPVEQSGHDKPRLFRLEEDNALINRMGFNNKGSGTVAETLEEYSEVDVPIGVNIGLSNDVDFDNASEEYCHTYRQLEEYGDYFVINVSCPNLPGLRSLQEGDKLEEIITTLQKEGASPLLIKLSPDMESEEIENAVEVADNCDIDGIIATNTSSKRPETLENPDETPEGGLSGEPIKEDSTKVIRLIAEETDTPIIGVGGVSTPEDAYEKIRAGADLVQLYTGLVYEGPKIAKNINNGLIRLIERDEFASIREAVGADVAEIEEAHQEGSLESPSEKLGPLNA